MKENLSIVGGTLEKFERACLERLEVSSLSSSGTNLREYTQTTLIRELLTSCDYIEFHKMMVKWHNLIEIESKHYPESSLIIETAVIDRSSPSTSL